MAEDHRPKADHHRRRSRTFWPEIEDEYKPALDHLTQREHQMTAFLRACLRMLVANPDRLLRLLEPFWPDPRPHGNPQLTSPSAADTDAATTAARPQPPDPGQDPARPQA